MIVIHSKTWTVKKLVRTEGLGESGKLGPKVKQVSA